MTTPPEHDNLADTGEADKAIDELARRSGASFRRPPPEGGANAARQAGTKIRRQRVAGGLVVGILAAWSITFAATRHHDPNTNIASPSSAPATTPQPVASSSPALPSTAATTVTSSLASTGTSPVASTVPATSEPAVVVTTDRNNLPPIQPAADAGIERIATVQHPSQITTDGTTVWVANDLGEISRFDAQTNALLGTVQVTKDDHAEQPALAFGSFWITTDTDNKLWRIDTATGSIVASIDIPGNIVGGNQLVNPINLAVGDGVLWVLAQTPTGSTIAKVDPATNQVTGTIPATSNSTQFIGYGDGSLWALTVSELLRINPSTGKELARVNTGNFPFMLRFGLGSVWTDIAEVGETLLRVDPATNTPTAKIASPPASTVWHGDISFGGGYAWSDSETAMLVKIDPATNQIIARYVKGSGGGAVAASTTAVWFTDFDANTIYRLNLT